MMIGLRTPVFRGNFNMLLAILPIVVGGPQGRLQKALCFIKAHRGNGAPCQ